MRQSNLLLTTTRNPPADTEVPSHRRLAQAGFIHKLTAGIYSYTPAMWRVLKKISNIVREEMDRAGAQEVMLPILQPREIWDRSGRWDTYVNHRILFHFRDRKDAEVCLGPTHEEVITTLTDHFVTSYKQLPVNLYQVQTKFRDEIRPRFGLMRGREFIMKDAYSFDADEEGMNVSYKKMEVAYSETFRRCGLSFSIVDADAGAIGGSGSQEFIVQASTGEDVFIINKKTGYAANQERAVGEIAPFSAKDEKPLALEKEKTPNAKTIEDLVSFFKTYKKDRFLKSVVYKAIYRDHEEYVVAFIRGDREINEVKLQNALDAIALMLATDEEIKKNLQIVPGYIGPVGLSEKIKVVIDRSVSEMVNFVAGANEEGYHFKNVNTGRDFKLGEVRDICLIQAGDLVVVDPGQQYSPQDRVVEETRGIEVGHIFKLGKKYSATMNATFTNAAGQEEHFWMGCYGIGVSRVAAAAIEQAHDEKGMIWPIPIAPWAVHLVCVNVNDQTQREAAEKLYESFQKANIEVLFDDRAVSPGIKFNDADLIGLPLRITVGRDAGTGEVEFVKRNDLKNVTKLKISDVLSQISTLISA